MAYKFQRGDAILSGALLQEGNVELASGFEVVIGNASMSEAELEMLDGITAGTVAASKAVVVDANKDISGLRNVTATGYFEIGSAQLVEADMELIDGLTAGTVAASKAVTVDASKDASGFRNIDGAGDLTMGTITMTGFAVDADGDTALKSLSLDDGSTLGPDSISDMMTFAGGGDITIKDGAYDFDIASHDASNGLKLGGVLVTSTAAELNLVDGITAGTIAASKAVIVDSNKDISGFRNVTATGYFEIGSAQLTESELEMLDGITAGTAAASKALVADANKDLSGLRNLSLEGALSGSSKLELGGTVRLDGVASATAVAADLVYFRDADDSLMKGESFADVRDNLIYASVSGDATVAAGGALTIAAAAVEHGMLNDNIISGQDELAHADIADADELMISDAGTVKRVGIDSLQNHYFAAISGDATVADGGALTIAADAVHGSMLNDDVISAQTELALDGLAAADELLLSDGGTLKKIGVDNLFADGPGLLTEAAVDVSADYVMFLDGGATGDAKKESFADLVSAMAGAGLTATSGQLSVTGNDVSLKADGDTLAEGYNYFADISAANVGVDLPAAPSVGDVVHVKAGNVTNDKILRVSCQGSHAIDGETVIDLESPYAAVSLVYVVANNWRIV
jgi:hypothetical protein